ncbi:MAG: rRNA pseudouridine synthase [Roseburia sp.]|nr:rRNA pseudouridine synthase [Roseburia sp.]
MRLDKFLTELGVGTRSEVKKILKTGQVTVNGTPVKKPEEKIDETKDVVTYQGKVLAYQQFEYYMFHKPAGCVTAVSDAQHKTVMDYMKDLTRKDLNPVGRLDIDTEGLLLITNDGMLSHELLSPAKHVPKTYYAKIDGRVTEADVNLFAKGVDIGEEKLTKPAELKILASDTFSEIELTISEGKFHQVKRMFEAVDKKVTYLKRISMGSLILDENLNPGTYRPLTMEEVAQLRAGH